MKFLSKYFFLIFICAQLTSSRPLPAQELEFGFRDMFKIRKITSPRLSPDGQYVLFENATADTSQNIWIKQIWRTQIGTGETLQITRGKTPAHFPRWSHDGQFIYFLTKRNPDYQNIYRMRNDGGEASPLFQHHANISTFELSHNGQTIYFLAKDTLTSEEQEREKKGNQSYFVDENLKPSQIWKFDLNTGTQTQLTRGDYSVREFCLSPDQLKIASVAAPSASQNDYLKREIYLIDLKSGDETKITNNEIAENQLAWSPDGQYLTFTSDANSRLETYYQDTIFLIDPGIGTIFNLLPDFKYQVIEYFWETKDRSIYFIANTGVNTQLFLLNRRNGKTRQLTSGDHEIRALQYIPGKDKMVYLESTPDRPFDIFYGEPEKGAGQPVTHMNDWLDHYAKARYQTVHWISPDGYTAEGILILPAKKYLSPYPLIVQLHGGPESSYRNYFGSSWSTYPQIWTSHGYAVFQPNYRGSTGYGDQVMRSIIGHYFEKDVDDIMSGVDYLINQGLVDPEKMAVMGWSAGGHLTNWIVTHFQRFKAACSGAGGANWSSFYAQTDVQYIREIWHMGPPYARSEYYQKKSPVNYVTNATTPTLILCGEQDRRVPFAQSLEMYRGLQRMNCPVKFIAFPEEGHSLKKVHNQLIKMQQEFQWIEQHLFERTWETEALK